MWLALHLSGVGWGLYLYLHGDKVMNKEQMFHLKNKNDEVGTDTQST